MDCSGTRLWNFVEIEAVPTTWNKIAFGNQLVYLIAVGGLCHPYCLSNGNRGKCKGIAICIGCKVEIQHQGVGA